MPCKALIIVDTNPAPMINAMQGNLLQIRVHTIRFVDDRGPHSDRCLSYFEGVSCPSLLLVHTGQSTIFCEPRNCVRHLEKAAVGTSVQEISKLMIC